MPPREFWVAMGIVVIVIATGLCIGIMATRTKRRKKVAEPTKRSHNRSSQQAPAAAPRPVVTAPPRVVASRPHPVDALFDAARLLPQTWVRAVNPLDSGDAVMLRVTPRPLSGSSADDESIECFEIERVPSSAYENRRPGSPLGVDLIALIAGNRELPTMCVPRVQVGEDRTIPPAYKVREDPSVDRLHRLPITDRELRRLIRQCGWAVMEPAQDD